VSAFAAHARDPCSAPNQIVVDETPMQVYMDLIIGALDQQASRMPFIAFFTPPF